MSSTMPWTVKIETTQGCNRSCKFCPVPLIYGKRYNFLTPEIVTIIAQQLRDWDAKRAWRFELAMLGEPTMNKHLPYILNSIRNALPKSQITVFSNGDIIKSQLEQCNVNYLLNLYNSGLNILAVDCYDKENLDFYTNLILPYGVTKYNYFDNDYPLYAKKSSGHELRDMVIINDLATSQDLGSVREMHNYGGNVDNSSFGISNEPVVAGCEKPFRDLVITHVGDVIICCLDANKDVKVGNIKNESLKDIWYGKKFMDIRRSLARQERIGRPCDTCSWFGGHKRFLAVHDFKNLL